MRRLLLQHAICRPAGTEFTRIGICLSLMLLLLLLNPGGTQAFFSSFSPAGRTIKVVTRRNRPSSLSLCQHHQQQRWPSRSSSLSMHMGHSHSHHDHHPAAAEIKRPPPTTRAGKFVRLITRRTARIFFAAAAILGPVLIRHRFRRLPSKSDFGLFVLTATSLTLLDGIRREVKGIIDKFQQLREGFAKHSTPIVDTKQIFQNPNSADRVTFLGVIINLALSIGKAIVGVTCHSSALIADAGHSLSDLFSDFITLWAVQLGRLPPDDDHPYGHGKFEAIGSLFLAMTLLATGVSVGAASGQKLAKILAAQRSGALLLQEVPTAPALIMAGLSIVSKEWLYRITKRVGEVLNSQVVIANAWHHRSDAYSSILALISIGLAMTVPSLLAADSAAGIIVAGMICMTGAEIFGESVKQLTDTNDERVVEKVEQAIRDSADFGDGSGDVLDVKRIRARQVGSSSIVDVSIVTGEGLSSTANRAIEERLRWTVMDVPGVIDAEVHSAPPAGTSEVVCPLLSAEEVRGNVQQPPSTSVVEEDVRRVLAQYQDKTAVQNVVVNYRDTMLVEVDCFLSSVDAGSTVAETVQLATDIRQRLEKEDDIDKANVYLDLNINNYISSPPPLQSAQVQP